MPENFDSSFSNQLFADMCAVWPATTVRSISKAMGRSEGYWSSIKAQKLAISKEALMTLTTHIEAKELQALHAEMKIRMREVRNGINQYLAERFIQEFQENEELRDAFIEQVKTGKKMKNSTCLPMPFCMSIY
jgi:hypothetical protein